MSTDADIDRLTDEVNSLLRKVETEFVKRKQKFSFEHDDGIDDDGDGDYGDGDSNPSMDASEADDDELDDEDEDDEDGIGKMRKLGARDRPPRYPGDSRHSGLHYPETDLMEPLQSNDATNRPGNLQTNDHSTWHSHVQRAVDDIARTENCSRTEAQRRLRARRPGIVNGTVSKSAPRTFEDAVEAEMRKSNLTREVAGQRVMQAYGSSLPKRMVKADYVEARFIEKANDIWNDDPTLSCTESLRAARLANPNLYKALNRS